MIKERDNMEIKELTLNDIEAHDLFQDIEADNDDKLWQEAMDEMVKEENKQYKLFRRNLNHYIKNRADGQPANSVKEFLADCDYNCHVGYVSVAEYDDNGWYAKHTGWDAKLFRVTEESGKKYPDLDGLTFTEETDDGYGRKPIKYLCWQRCEFEDSFYGYLMFPMKNGKYWCTYFRM